MFTMKDTPTNAATATDFFHDKLPKVCTASFDGVLEEVEDASPEVAAAAEVELVAEVDPLFPVPEELGDLEDVPEASEEPEEPEVSVADISDDEAVLVALSPNDAAFDVTESNPATAPDVTVV